MRVVLYTEGPGEGRGERGSTASPGERLSTLDLGAGHILVGRLLAEVCGVPREAVQFIEGLRTRRGKLPSGSHLSDPATLRQLLTWASPTRAPDVAVILVDRDGLAGRHRALRAAYADLPNASLIVSGVARESFEAWLLADEGAVRRALGSTATVKALEKMKPGAAKQLLASWTSAIEPEARHQARLELARHCDLDTLAQASKSFARFRDDLEGLRLAKLSPPAPPSR